MESLILVAHLALAAMLGAMVGFERQWRQRLAGLRTNALVALGAASYVSFSTLTPGEVSPTRVAAQVVSGIGFIGAGVIFREGLNVRGLNTAATLWCSAAVGVFAGAGMAGPAALCALLVLGVNVGLRPLVQLINRSPPVDAESEYPYRVRVQCRADREAFVRALLLHAVQDTPLRLVQIESRDTDGSNAVEVGAELVAPQRAHELLERIVGRLSLEPTVLGAAWRVGEPVE